MAIALRLRARGRVQRVGFRRYAQEVARELGLAGWVKNLPDGSVQIHVQGPQEAVQAFMERLRKAPAPIRVEQVVAREVEPEPGLKYFRIIYGPLEEELQEGFGAMQNIFMQYWREFREFRQEFRDYRQEFRDFRQEMREEFKALRQELQDFRREFRDFREEFRDFRRDFNEFREEVRGEFKALRQELGGLRQDVRSLAEGLGVKLPVVENGGREGERGFEFLEHTADQYVLAYGPDLKAAFEEAAKGLFATMTDLEAVRPEVAVELQVEGHDLKALLYNWLEALLVKFETESLLFRDFDVLELSGGDGKPYRLRAVARGEPFDPERHPQHVGVKAITYHLMEIKQEPGRVELRFLLDI